MESLTHCIVTCSGYLHQYLKEISISLVATALFLYGRDIHGLVKRQIQSLALVPRGHPDPGVRLWLRRTQRRLYRAL